MSNQLFMPEFMEEPTESIKTLESVKRRVDVRGVKRPDVQNGMPFQGMVIVDGSPVDFYGSDAAWQRFKSSVGEM